MQIIKKILRFMLKKKMRSSSLKDSRNIIHQVALYFLYRKNSQLLERNNTIKHSSDGKRCFIFFTGTSVANFNFDLLKEEPVIACGMAVVHKDFNKCNVIAYFDPGPWEPRSLLYLDVVFSAVYRSTKKGCGVFLHTTAYPYVNELTSYRQDDTYFMASDGNYLSSEDIKSDLHELNNIQEGSVSTALGISSYLGFEEIYLLGQDYMSDPVIYGHFYDGFNEIGSPADYQSYRERGMWMIEHLKKKGCRVINVVKDEKQKSSLDSITFKDLENLLIN